MTDTDNTMEIEEQEEPIYRPPVQFHLEMKPCQDSPSEIIEKYLSTTFKAEVIIAGKTKDMSHFYLRPLGSPFCFDLNFVYSEGGIRPIHTYVFFRDIAAAKEREVDAPAYREGLDRFHVLRIAVGDPVFGKTCLLRKAFVELSGSGRIDSLHFLASAR